MNVSLQSLVGKLDEQCRSALEGAAGLCLARTNSEVEVEKRLPKLLERRDPISERSCVVMRSIPHA